MIRQLLFSILLLPGLILAQSNISMSNATASAVLQGNYDPQHYQSSNPISNPAQIICELNELVSPDSLLYSLQVLASFDTRHTLSDTTSANYGIGAARRWIHSRLQYYASQNDQRLLPGYLSFDYANTGCGDAQDLRNVLAVLPGSDTSQAGIIIIEGHMDSRCEGRCDSICSAPGVDDNASGTALVLELARVMSAYSYEHTIVFMLTTGEEQGLLGAEAMAAYVAAQNIPVKAVLNNDVVGGTVCGQTASPPGCSPVYSVDSTRVRLYANPQSQTNPSQDLSRSLKMFYDEKLKSQVAVPMNIEIINQLDRVGRGGDHIPFSNLGIAASRFTAANEHGDASVGPNYVDHQHTGNDVLGADTTGDGVIDTFFVDVNYLARNTVINGVGAAQLALGPERPDFTLSDSPNGMLLTVNNPSSPQYRVGVREFGEVDFQAVYRFSANQFLIPGLNNGVLYYISLAAIDSNEVMSPFSISSPKIANSSSAVGPQDALNLIADCSTFGLVESLHSSAPEAYLQSPVPNPSRGVSRLGIRLSENDGEQDYSLKVFDLGGQLLRVIPLQLEWGENELDYQHQGGSGSFLLQLTKGEKPLNSQKLIVH